MKSWILPARYVLSSQKNKVFQEQLDWIDPSGQASIMHLQTNDFDLDLDLSVLLN